MFGLLSLNAWNTPHKLTFSWQATSSALLFRSWTNPEVYLLLSLLYQPHKARQDSAVLFFPMVQGET